MKLKYYLRGIAAGIIFTISVMGLTGANKKQEMSDSQIIHAAKNLGMVESSNSVSITGIAPTPVPEEDESKDSGDSSEDTKVTPVPDDSEGQQNVSGEALTQEPLEEGSEDHEMSPGEKVEEDLGPAITIVVTATPTVAPTPTVEPTPTTAPTSTPTPTVAPTSTPTPKPTATPTPKPTKAPEPTKEPAPTKAPEKSDATVDKEDTVSLSIVKGMYSESIAQAAYELGLVKSEKDFNEYLVDNNFASKIHIGTYKISKDASYYEIAVKITSKNW